MVPFCCRAVRVIDIYSSIALPEEIAPLPDRADGAVVTPTSVVCRSGMKPSSTKTTQSASLVAAAADVVTAAANRTGRTVLLLMGMSGGGKTTIAPERALGWSFADGDNVHSGTNVEKLRSYRPLNEQDRLPWLKAVVAWIDDRLDAGEPGIITGSNL